ncbi:MAG: hypothetical protein J6Y03_00310 [Alphaproteobacteria bacterium]|nr:hypothetical protein [Alphaproteobacteria bacterium]
MKEAKEAIDTKLVNKFFWKNGKKKETVARFGDNFSFIKAENFKPLGVRSFLKERTTPKLPSELLNNAGHQGM